MHGSQTETRSEGFWQTLTSVLAALATKGGGSLRDNPLPELRYTAREWDRVTERRAEVARARIRRGAPAIQTSTRSRDSNENRAG